MVPGESGFSGSRREAKSRSHREAATLEVLARAGSKQRGLAGRLAFLPQNSHSAMSSERNHYSTITLFTFAACLGMNLLYFEAICLFKRNNLYSEKPSFSQNVGLQSARQEAPRTAEPSPDLGAQQRAGLDSSAFPLRLHCS